jgi:DNA invertase Pin-like site-specific DNA recombinase
MAKGKFVAYYRVSTGKQALSGLGLEAQKDAVADFLNGGRWTLLDEFVEVESGKNSDRSQLALALALCRLHNATLVVAKLDRLARNLHFLSGLMESGCEFVCCDMPTANRLTIHVLAAVAEAEALAISQRTKVALQAAKRRGVVLGGDRGGLTKKVQEKGRAIALQVRQQRAAKRAADLLPIIEVIREQGALSLQDIANGLNERNIPTARGGTWQPVQVMRVLQRVSLARI